MVENALKSHINSTKYSELEREKKKQTIWGCQSGLLINQLIMESIKRKIKEEDRYVLLYDESLNQQLKKSQLDIKTILELS